MNRELPCGDQLPGDPAAMRLVAQRFGLVESNADEIGARLRNLACCTGDLLTGSTAEAFADQIEDLLPDLARAWHSFGMAKLAVFDCADALDHAQDMARRAAADAAAADAERSTAAGRRDAANEEHTWYQTQLNSATATLTSTKLEMTTLAVLPDPIRAALLDQRCRSESARCAQLLTRAKQASDLHRCAQHDVSMAEARLAAARRLADSARSLRDSAARTAAGRLDEASDAGIRNSGVVRRASRHMFDPVAPKSPTCQENP